MIRVTTPEIGENSGIVSMLDWHAHVKSFARTSGTGTGTGTGT